jgi:cadmium resistance protein CadD (predicted permease)
MDAIIYPVAVFLITGIVGICAGRFAIKPKSDERLERVERAVEAIPYITKGVHALLESQITGEVNGKCHKAHEDLEDYMCKNK